MTSPIFRDEFKQETSDDDGPLSDRGPEEHLTSVLDDDAADYSMEHVDDYGYELRQGDLKQEYSHEPEVMFEYESEFQNDPLAVELISIKQENMPKGEFNIADEEELIENPIVEDCHFSSASEDVLEITRNISKALTLTTGLKTLETMKSDHHELVNRTKLHECTKCAYKSGCESNIKAHFMGRHAKDNSYKCTLCKYTSGCSEELRTHVMTIHAKCKPYKCHLCSFSASWTDGLRHHMKTHSDIKPYKCTLCPYSNKYEDGLKLHMKTHYENKPHKCTLCQFSSVYASSLSVHMKTHSDKKPYKCNLCAFSSRYENSLQGHIKTHDDNKPYECTLCPFRSRYARSIKIHMSTHSGSTPFKCKMCSFSTVWSNSLKGHMKTHKCDKTDTFQCAHCNRRFLRKILLTKHIKKRHMISMK